MKIKDLLNKYFDKILDVLIKVDMSILIFLCVLIFIDVFCRYIFNNPLFFTLAVAELGMIFLVSFGFAWLLKEEGHIVIDLVFAKLKPKYRNLINILTSFISSIVLFTITYYTIPTIIRLYKLKARFSYTSHLIPAYVYLIPLSIGLFTFGIQYLRRTFYYFSKYNNKEN